MKKPTRKRPNARNTQIRSNDRARRRAEESLRRAAERPRLPDVSLVVMFTDGHHHNVGWAHTEVPWEKAQEAIRLAIVMRATVAPGAEPAGVVFIRGSSVMSYTGEEARGFSVS